MRWIGSSCPTASQALHFQLSDPPAIQVWFESQGTNRKATYIAKVRLDRGYSGVACVYSLKGTVDDEFATGS